MRSSALSACIARFLCSTLLCFGGAGAACNALLDNREVELIGRDAARELPDAAPADATAPDSGDGEAEAGIDPAPSAPEAAAPECSPPDIEQERVPCGLCDKGTRPRQRTCDAGGSWGEWSFTGACDDAAVECEPDAVEAVGTLPCGPCAAGVTPLRRRCDPDECVWLPPAADTGDCQFAETLCWPGDIQRVPTQSCGACNKGSIVETRACTSRCEWGEPATSGCVYLDNTCDPKGPTRYRCKPPRDADPEQAYRETCFAADYGQDGDPAALAVRCTYGSDDREPCSRNECPDCY